MASRKASRKKTPSENLLWGSLILAWTAGVSARRTFSSRSAPFVAEVFARPPGLRENDAGCPRARLRVTWAARGWETQLTGR
jgi:hypothetical protein